MAVNDLRGQTFTCQQTTTGNTTTCFCMFPSSYPSSECLLAGDDVLSYYEIGGASIGNWVGVLIAISVVLRIMFYVTIRLQKPKV